MLKRRSPWYEKRDVRHAVLYESLTALISPFLEKSSDTPWRAVSVVGNKRWFDGREQ